MTISEELKELYASGSTSVLLHTLSFNHSSWDSEFFIVRDFQNFTANLEDSGPSTLFQRFAFTIKGPSVDENGNQVLQVKVDAVSQEFIVLLEQASADTNTNPIEVTYRAYLDTDTTGPQNTPPLKLWMRKVQVTDKAISGQAELIALENRKFPNVVYDNVFQSLVHAS